MKTNFTIKSFKDVSKKEGIHENVLIYLNELDKDGEELAIECDYYIEYILGDFEYGTTIVVGIIIEVPVVGIIIEVYNFRIIDVYNNKVEISLENEKELIQEIKEYLEFK
jgi:hypothetical protein